LSADGARLLPSARDVSFRHTAPIVSGLASDKKNTGLSLAVEASLDVLEQTNGRAQNGGLRTNFRANSMAQSLDSTGIETEASLQPDILQSVDLSGQRLCAVFGATAPLRTNKCRPP